MNHHPAITLPAGEPTATIGAPPSPTPSLTSITGAADAGTGTIDLTSWLGVLLSAGVIAAVITGVINLCLARAKTREGGRARVRSTLAEALQACADYKEMPYAIRRRDAAKPADERLRLANELRSIQSRLAYYESWVAIEAPALAKPYADLVQTVRAVAGGAMHDAWEAAAIDSDAAMNIPASLVDLSSIKPAEDAYRAAAAFYVTHPRRRRLTK